MTLRLIGLILLLSTGLAYASESSGTIDTSNYSARICKDASCTSYSSVNFKPTGAAAITIADAGLSGYAWGDEVGWINFAPTGFGVSVTPATGALSGYAFASVGSWINFNPTDVSGGTDVGVSINSAGQLTGWAWVSGVSGGWLKFDCASASTCVKTDWRPSGSRASSGSSSSGSQSSGSSGASGNFTLTSLLAQIVATPGATASSGNENPSESPTADEGAPSSGTAMPNTPASGTQAPSAPGAPQEAPAVYIARSISDVLDDLGITLDASTAASVRSYNAPLSLPSGSAGLLVWEFPSARPVLNVPTAIVIQVPSSASKKHLNIFSRIARTQVLPKRDGYTLSPLGPLFEVHARDLEGQRIDSFAKPLRITLSVPQALPDSNYLAVYALSEGESEWREITGVTYGASSATFATDHLSVFGVFQTGSVPKLKAGSTMPLPSTLLWVVIPLILAILALGLRMRARA